ncbi:hypothetical protein BCR43DRAFT_566624 [Syncephalastrum racemosum]|uniref:Glutathione S-transferase n=1 Tax=Syncephalastrum racemosum TaxID=13706 RepID=A0A1X2H0S2_SYNRA|nr:hypothetical protein BCR43DRAFT_566624 [Syncephalastrum racemosum]
MTGIGYLKLYYFDLGTRGKGENIKLLLQDAGVPHEYVRIKQADWPTIKPQLQEKGNVAGCLPAVETETGKFYTGTIPTMRTLSRKLGKYMPSDDEQQHVADLVADLSLDWFNTFFDIFHGKITLDEHHKTVMPKHITRVEQIYGENEGPYLLGSEICYADFLIFHILWDENLRHQAEYPNLRKMQQAIESRPNLKDYLASLPAEKSLSDLFK